MKKTQSFLKKLEDFLQFNGFKVRYEKGNFQSGYCILKTQKVVVVNKYFTLEGKIQCLIELVNSLKMNNKDNFPIEYESIISEINKEN